MKTCSVLRRVVRRSFSFVLIPLMNAGLMAAPPAGWRTDPTPAVSATEFLSYSGVNVHFNYFSYGWSIGGVPPAWANRPGYNHSGFSSAWGSQKWREWLNLCVDNNIRGIRIMSPFGDGRNLFDTAGNISINEALFRADLDAFLRIVNEVETQRNVKFRLIFTLFDFRIADGEWIDGVGEHPDIMDPASPKRAQFLNLFRDKFFKMVYDPAQPYAQWGLVRENRIVWQLVNEFVSMKPDTGGRSELQAMDDLAYQHRREALYVQGESFFLAFRDMIKNVRPTALVSLSDLGAENTIRRWQNKGFDLLDYHSHPDYLHYNGNIGTTLKNVGWNGTQPIIEGEAYIPGWRSVDKAVLTERLRASYQRGSRGGMFWWDGWYRFDPSIYKTITIADLAFVRGPDLVVESISGPDRPSVGDSVSFGVTVGNWGSVNAGESVLKIQMDGSYLSEFTVPALAPGQTFVTSRIPWTATSGHHRFLAEADNWFRNAEHDEDNNNVSKQVVGVPALADLVVENVEGTEGLMAGLSTTFKVTVANRGREIAGESALKLQIDGREIATVMVPLLSPGKTHVSNVSWIALAGEHMLRVEADNWQRVVEMSESNNNVDTSLLVTAPAIHYSRFFGGAGTSRILDVVTDKAGNTIVVGETDGGGFPVTGGVWDTRYNGGTLDGFVAKFSANGTLLFSTYLGGSGEDSALGVALDGAGNIMVTGKTYSSNFPTTSGAYDRTLGGARDAFLAKLTPDGKSVVYGTYLGGSSWDYGHRVAMAPGGDVVVTGFTHGGYPVTTGAAQTVFGGAGDVFVTRLNAAGNAAVYSTYLGGNSWDGAGGLAVDDWGQVILSGDTHSPTFPTTTGAWDRSCSNCGTNTSTDGYLAKLSAKGDRWIFSTFVGGSATPSTESLRRIAVAPDGSIWAVGTSNGADFPVTVDAVQPRLGGGADAVVVRFNDSGSKLLYGSYLGGTGRDLAMDVQLDGEGGIIFVGTTDSSNFPTTSDGVQKNHRGSTDAFLVKLKPGKTLSYSTYWGGTGTELEGLALTKDITGNLILAGGTGSSDLPVLGVPANGNGGGSSDGFLVVFKGIALPDVVAPPQKPTGTKFVSKKGRPVLAWKANGNLPGTSYQVYGSTSKVFQLWTSTTSLEVTPALKPGVLYYFKVRARNKAKEVSLFDQVVSTRIAKKPLASGLIAEEEGETESLPESPPLKVVFAGEEGPDVSILLDPVDESLSPSFNEGLFGKPWRVSVDGKDTAFLRVTSLDTNPNRGLSVVRWEEIGAAWEEIAPGESAPPGIFAVRQAIPPSASSSKIYPNPFRPARGHTSVKMEVPLGSTVRLFTLTGELVRELSPDSEGVILWRGDNGAGQSVASGVYFCFIEKDGDKKIFRLAVEQ